MIGKITGNLIMIRPPQVMLEVNSIGYEISIPISDCSSLPTLGACVTLYTHLVIREDAHQLYGFINLDTRDCFRILIKVSGIGPKIALALLSTLNITELHQALDEGDINTLCRTPGVGKKMAERMILELNGKLHFKSSLTSLDKDDEDILNKGLKLDITNALESLGFGDKEIRATLKNLNEITDLKSGIKEALKLLNRH